MIQFFKNKIYVVSFLLLFLFVTATVGYKLLSDIPWLDAFYMAVITIATVGFREYVPDTAEAKIFTIFIIISSLIIIGYSLSIVTEYIFSKNILNQFIYKKVQQKIDKLSNHIIVCGFGRNGSQAAAKLSTYKKPYVVVERDEQLIEGWASESKLFVKGDASNDEVLLKAGILKASFLITALPSDADNLYVVLTARQLNPKLTIISRASQESSYKKLKLAGADNVIMPDKIGGDHMASLVVSPDLTEFIDRLSIVGENAVNIEEICIKDMSSGKNISSIRDLDLRKLTGCTVIGMKNSDGDYTINPDPDTQLNINSRIIVLGKTEQIKKLNELF
ncbi:MAG: potassium channel protein [Flavobacteriaceae bacterium]|nr:potassium channel protein [Flavobacteriaceae bacterium]